MQEFFSCISEFCNSLGVEVEWVLKDSLRAP